MPALENLPEQIRYLENLFADRLAQNANNKELSAIFIQIKSLKEQLGITCHTQLTMEQLPSRHVEIDLQALFH